MERSLEINDIIVMPPPSGITTSRVLPDAFHGRRLAASEYECKANRFAVTICCPPFSLVNRCRLTPFSSPFSRPLSPRPCSSTLPRIPLVYSHLGGLRPAGVEPTTFGFGGQPLSYVFRSSGMFSGIVVVSTASNHARSCAITVGRQRNFDQARRRRKI